MNEVVTQQQRLREVAPRGQAITPMDMLSMAVQQGSDLDKLEKLMGLQERWEANEARKAFVRALNAFKASPPELVKNKHVSFTTKVGRTEYSHATLDHVSEEIGKALAVHGLSHRWDVEQLDGGMIRVICVLTHESGHSERVPLICGADQSGGKNNIQALGSAVTYLQRYTLLAATGMAVRDQDDDGEAAAPSNQEPPAQGVLTPDQVASLEKLCKAGGVSEERVLRYGFAGSVPEGASLADMSLEAFNRCVAKLNATIKQKRSAENAGD